MRYFLILSTLVLLTPALLVWDYSGLFNAYACDGCAEPTPEPRPTVEPNTLDTGGNIRGACSTKRDYLHTNQAINKTTNNKKDLTLYSIRQARPSDLLRSHFCW